MEEQKAYYSEKSSLKFWLQGRRQSFQNGVFIAKGREQIVAMEQYLAGMPEASRSLIRTIDAVRAVEIAKKHAALLGPAAIQGGQTTAAHAKQIQQITQQTLREEAAHTGVVLQPQPGDPNFMAPADHFAGQVPAGSVEPPMSTETVDPTKPVPAAEPITEPTAPPQKPAFSFPAKK